MTPMWIDKNAEKVGPNAVMYGYYEILPSTGAKYQRALRVPLIETGVISPTDSFTVTITVALDTTLADTDDHDPIFGISDRKYFLGFQTLDVHDYPNYSPCYRLEGSVGESILENRQQGGGPKTNTTHYSSEVRVQIRPTEHWGSCHTEQADGLVNQEAYKYDFDPSDDGMYLEFYRHNAEEEYRIKFIKVEIDMD